MSNPARQNQLWNITIQPMKMGDVKVTLPAAADCNAKGAICAVDEPDDPADKPVYRPLSQSVMVVVP